MGGTSRFFSPLKLSLCVSQVIDGPFTEAKELVAGYTMIQVASREEAMEWARRFPNPAVDGGRGEIEVREFYELEDFGDLIEIERFRKLEADRKGV